MKHQEPLESLRQDRSKLEARSALNPWWGALENGVATESHCEQGRKRRFSRDLPYLYEHLHFRFGDVLLFFREGEFDPWIAGRSEQCFSLAAVTADESVGDLFEMRFA